MPATFRALRHRGFRTLWTASLVSSIGTWMQILGQSLLVLKLTQGSAVALGTVSLSQALSFLLFALAGGGIADHFDKRKLLLVTQSIAAALAVLLGSITAAGEIRFWMIVVLAFCSGAVLSVDQPARTALLPRLVPPAEVSNAIALQATIFSAASIVGPALAGVSMTRVGFAGMFYLNAASFLVMIGALLAIRPPDSEDGVVRAPLLQSVKAALGQVGRDAMLPWILLGYGALLFFGPSPALLLPVFATRVLHMGAQHLGLLFSAVGVGSVLGSLGVASLVHEQPRGLLFAGSLAVWSAALIAFGRSGGIRTAVSFLLVMGAAQAVASATSIFLLQTRVPVAMRGRVMSLNTLLLMGVRPLGDFPIGALISLAGVPAATLVSALSVVAAAAVVVGRRAIRNSES